MIHKQLAASTAEVVLRNALPLPLVFGPPGTTEAQGGRKSMKPDPQLHFADGSDTIFQLKCTNFQLWDKKNDDIDDDSY